VSDDVEPSLGDLLYVEVDHEAARIVLVGEFDMTGGAPFWAAVSEALAPNPPSLTVETRGLTFIDSSGLAALVRAREAADEAAWRSVSPNRRLRCGASLS
jgi:anti-anti-sigma regulatory factor